MNNPAGEPSKTSPAAKSAMITVFLVMFIDLLGFGIVLPLIPRYANAKDGIPAETSNFVRGLAIGGLLSVFSAMQFFFAPLWGRISDRVGRRPILLIGLAGSVVFYGLFGLVSDLATGWLLIGLIFATRIGAGLSGATISTASAVIADCTTKEKRSHGMALIGAAFGIGFTFGPLIAWAGVELFPNQHGGPGYLAAFLSLIALIIAYRKMPETLPPGGVQVKRSLLDMKGLYQTLQTPTVGLLVLAFFLTTFGFANFEGTLSLLTLEVFHFSDRGNYLMFAYIGFVLTVTQGFIYRRLVKKMHEAKLMRIGIVAMFVGLGGLALMLALDAPSVGGLMLAAAVCVFGFAFLNPSLNGLISKRSDPHRQGEILGINQSFSALARILGPVIGMILFTVEGTHVLPYALAAVMLAFVLVLLTKVKELAGENVA